MVFRVAVRIDLKLKMIFNFISAPAGRGPQVLSELKVGERAVVDRLELAPSTTEYLINLGFVPGLVVTVARSGPGGDPRIYRVDGTEIALRRDVSRRIAIRPLPSPTRDAR